MRTRLWRQLPLSLLLSGAAWLSTTAPACADGLSLFKPRGCATPDCATAPATDCRPGSLVSPGTSLPEALTPSQTPSSLEPDTSLESRSLAYGGGVFSAVGYIDTAIISNKVRLRYDSAWDNNRPDRAEFFYPKCGCFRVAGIDPNARGPALPESSVDFQMISTYVEAAVNDRFSVFIDAPVTFLNPEQNQNTAGLGDINFGGRYALIQDCNRVLTCQLRTFVPTGDADRGLGTYHWSLEPSLLLFNRINDRWTFEGEFRDWIPIQAASDFAGNVLRYGGGLSYLLYDSERFAIRPVAELVGWTVLGGKDSDVTGFVQDAAGDTIVNAKLGARVSFGEHSSIYVGYGRALTGDVWYKDVVRAEYRLSY